MSTPEAHAPGEPLADSAAELAALGQALRAHVARAEFFGVERAARPAPASASAGARPAPSAAPQRPPTPTGAPQDRSRVAPTSPRTPSARPEDLSRRPSAPQRGTGAPPGGPVTADPRFTPTYQAAQAAGTLEALAATVSACTACGLCKTRTQTVFADGSSRARVMFIGDAPGADEDRTGVPFVGRAGQLLTDIITKGMGLGREDVYIANVLKCRPPGNRDPLPAEKQLCTPFLQRQIELVDPEILIPLGRHASNHLLGQDAPMGQLRGRVHEAHGRKVVPTFHPEYLLRSPAMKKPTWEDIQLAMAELGLRPPS